MGIMRNYADDTKFTVTWSVIKPPQSQRLISRFSDFKGNYIY